MMKYKINEGVAWVNGRKVKKGEKTIELTRKEATFDLAQGRISEMNGKPKFEQKSVLEAPKQTEKSEK